MANPGDVVDRADALMRRRRSFVAKPAARAPATGTADAADERDAPIVDARLPSAASGEDDDLPVLTDVVPIEDDDRDAADRRQERFNEMQVALLASEIAHAIGEQLSSDLPKLIATALTDAGEQLSSGIGATMETALRDFIARRRQLALPLDEPHDGQSGNKA